MARLRYLDVGDVEHIVHRLAANLFRTYPDPLPPYQLFGGLREGGALLESALALPRQPYYRTIYDKAGAMLRSLIKNHPLVDGNKRVGLTATLVFLGVNRHLLIASNDEMVRFALQVAVSEPDISFKEVAAWLRRRSIRPVTSRKTSREIQARLPREWEDPEAVEARIREYMSALSSSRAEVQYDR